MAKMNILVIGGSGFLSGTLARRAVAAGHNVWTITRGERDIPAGVTSLIADRHDEAAFKAAVDGANTRWDLVVDSIGFQPADARQDIAVFQNLTPHLVFVSTDFVYDPAKRALPQTEETDFYLSDGYGANKRLCELELINGDTGNMAWTVVRPCHIYGPGSKLGCLPLHGRDEQLLDRLKAGDSLKLVGGGHFLQQPILAADLADLIVSLAGNEKAFEQIFNATGPDTIESNTYYQIIADILGVEMSIEEVPVQQYLAENPHSATFLCHRIYDSSKLRATGAAVPSTPIEEGLRQHVEWLLNN